MASKDWVPVDSAVVRQWCTAAVTGEALAQRGSSLEHAPVLPPGGKLRAIQSTGNLTSLLTSMSLDKAEAPQSPVREPREPRAAVSSSASDRSSLSVEAASQSSGEGGGHGAGPGDSRGPSVDGHGTVPLLPAGMPTSTHGGGGEQQAQAPKSPNRRAVSPLGGLFGSGGRKTKHARHGSKGSASCWGVQEGTE